MTDVTMPAMYRGALAYRPLEDGRCLVVYRMMPGQLRLTVGADRGGTYDDFWCFHEHHAAQLVQAFHGWDGNGECPGPWYRHGATARRRELGADGQVIREYVQR